MNLPIELIEPGTRLREVSPAKVTELIVSIGDVGLLNPITVFPRQLHRGGLMVEGYGLIAGAHRLEAFRQMGRTEIPATVLELGDLERQIAECDENLQGPSLTPSERARFFKRRKEAYEALHPELRHGANKGEGGRFAPSRQVGDTDEKQPQSFAAATAAATGISERTVHREAERGQKILPEVLDMIRGTALDTGAYLDKLKQYPGSEQYKIAKRDLTFSKAKAREAKKKAAAATPEGKAKAAARKAADRIMREWERADVDARAIFKKEAGLS